MSRAGTNKRKSVYDKYGRNEANIEVGAGPLRPRGKRDKTFGRCQGWCDKSRDEELYGGLCSWCLWMINDTEAGEG